MQRFQDVETRTPVILTTSQLLTTGLDAPTCRNIVLLRLVNSMPNSSKSSGAAREFGTTTASSGSTSLITPARPPATLPIRLSTATRLRHLEEIDEHGKTKSTEVLTPEVPEDEGGEIHEPPGGTVISDPPPPERRKFYYDGGQVEIAAELVHELDADGKQLRVIKLTDYTAEKVRTLCTSPDELRVRWANASQRADIIQQLAERGIDFQTVAAQAGKPDADPFDMLCHLAFNAPVFTRRQRADRVKSRKRHSSNSSPRKPAKF